MRKVPESDAGCGEQVSKFPRFPRFQSSKIFEALKLWHFETLPALYSAQRYSLPLGSKTHRFLGARRSGRQKIEKRTCFGGPCFEGTLQKPTGVSESSPVAGTIENSTFSENLDAGRTREIQTNYDPAATLLLSVNCLYQMNKKNCKGQFEKCVSLPIWFRNAHEIRLDVTSVTAFGRDNCAR